MGAKTSTVSQAAGGNGQSSNGGNDTTTTIQGFSILRSLPGGTVAMLQQQQQHQQTNSTQSSRLQGDNRQRARSLSSVPDLTTNEQNNLGSNTVVGGVNLANIGVNIDSDDGDEDSGSRVYAAHSLPSHIWSLNGKIFFLNLSSKKKHSSHYFT